MKNKLIAAIMAVLTIFSVLGCGIPSALAFAEETVDIANYTDVLDDLQKDESFDKTKYPAKPNDYTIEVIQIAESSDGELFVYVYQHLASPLSRATSINISKSIGENLSYSNYKLQFLNEQNTLAKYLVLDFEVSKLSQRYYDISSIYRNWSSQIDKDEDRTTENKVSERAFAVGMRYEVITNTNGEVEIAAEKRDVLEITEMYAGTLLYEHGLTVWGEFVPFAPRGKDYVSSFYVAFSIDNSKYVIDSLLEADVGYSKVIVSADAWVWDILFSDLKSKAKVEGRYEGLEAKLKCTDHESVSGLFGATYNWDRIQKVSDFIADPDIADQITDDVVTDMKNGKYQWVLRFYEDEWSLKDYRGLYWQIRATGVYDVSILRLKFMMGTDTYNLGVVSNKSSVAGPTTEFGKSLERWNNFWKQVNDFFDQYGIYIAIGGGVLILVIVIGILAYFLKPFRGAIKEVLKWLGLAIYYIITALPRLIVFIGEKVKERRNISKPTKMKQKSN